VRSALCVCVFVCVCDYSRRCSRRYSVSSRGKALFIVTNAGVISAARFRCLPPAARARIECCPRCLLASLPPSIPPALAPLRVFHLLASSLACVRDGSVRQSVKLCLLQDGAKNYQLRTATVDEPSLCEPNTHTHTNTNTHTHNHTHNHTTTRASNAAAHLPHPQGRADGAEHTAQPRKQTHKHTTTQTHNHTSSQSGEPGAAGASTQTNKRRAARQRPRVRSASRCSVREACVCCEAASRRCAAAHSAACQAALAAVGGRGDRRGALRRKQGALRAGSHPHACMHARIHACTIVLGYACVHTYAHAHAHTQGHTHARAHTLAQAHTRARTCTHIQPHNHTMHTQANAPKRRPARDCCAMHRRASSASRTLRRSGSPT
jgi:hypothetical protein